MRTILSRAWSAARDAPIAWFVPLLLVLSVPQAPLYTSNQNTKFLHGAAAAGHGGLADDWTANTLDPLPVFSALVRMLFELRAPWLSYLAFAALLLVYYVALLRIARRHVPGLQAPGAMPAFVALFLLFNKTGTWYSMETGLAGQYLLGRYFQPCVFGAFLLLGLERGLAGRLVAASACLALAVAMHPTYVPAAGLLFAALAVLTWRRGGGGRMLALGGLVFLPVVAAIVAHHAWAFAPTDTATWQRSVAILAHERIPEHTQVARWFDAVDAVRLLVMAAAIGLVRREPLGWILAVLFVPMALSIGVLAFIPFDWLAFTTPWRLSVVLMPVATTLILAVAAGRIAHVTHARGGSLAPLLPTMAIAAMVVWGLVQQVRLVERHHASTEMEVIAWARAHAAGGQTYLVPPEATRFEPFRLHTGVPIVVNWKTHPYKDAEVIEWHRRLAEVQAVYEGTTPDRCRSLEALRQRHRVTHAVFARAEWPGCEGWQPLHTNERFVVLGYTQPTVAAAARGPAGAASGGPAGP